MTNYKDYDDKYNRRRHTRCVSGATCTKITMVLLLLIGVYLLVSNSYGLYVRFTNNFGKSYSKEAPQKIAWIYAKHVSFYSISFFLVFMNIQIYFLIQPFCLTGKEPSLT